MPRDDQLQPARSRTPSPKPAPLYPPNTLTIRLITDNAAPTHPPFPLPPPTAKPHHHHQRDGLRPGSPGSPLPLPLPRPRPRAGDHVPIPRPPPGGGHVGGGGGPPSVIVTRGRPMSWARQKDAFYAAWDRFTQQKQRSRDSGVAAGGSSGDRAVDKPASSRGRSERSSKNVSRDGSARSTAVPGLDTDVEGRPTHVDSSNDQGVKTRHRAGESYEAAAHACRTKVAAIVRECRRLNQKYYDRQFCLPEWDTLVHLGADERPTSVKELMGVGAVKRVEDIFDEPAFFEDGPTPQDIRQGNIGNCYFLAALGALGGKPALIERLCVARDELVGVYGFVFFRDGEWISEIVDDRLCLRYTDDIAKNPTDFLVVTRGDQNAMQQPLSEMSYAVQRLPKDFYQSLRKGSSALYFGSCRESNETWLPLIEKAYAKAHGDYQAIDGGVTGEGIEDLTGGVASFVRSENVLDKDKLWQELMQVNVNFLFGCGTRKGRDSESADDEGFVRGHAYTVLAAHEIDAPPMDDRIKLSSKKRKEEEEKRKKEIKNGKVRLLKVHNPWGRQEFNGDWSDMSNRWTPELLKELGHTIGDDGTFFISYMDFLKFFPVIDRIRLINHDWTVCQQWTSVNVPWTTDYLDTSFRFTITKAGPVVLVLSQPDTRYFKGLTGRYKYALHFRLYQDGEETYLLRSMEQSGNMRSCNAEVVLEAGTYELLVKVTAERFHNKRTPQQIIREYRNDRREKLLAIGKSFDLAHGKGRLREFEKANLDKDVEASRQKTKLRMSKSRDFRRRERQMGKKRKQRAMAEMKRKQKDKAQKHKEQVERKRQAATERRKAEGAGSRDRDRRRRNSSPPPLILEDARMQNADKSLEPTPGQLKRENTVDESALEAEQVKQEIETGLQSSVMQLSLGASSQDAQGAPTPSPLPAEEVVDPSLPMKAPAETVAPPANQSTVFEPPTRTETVDTTVKEANQAKSESSRIDRPQHQENNVPTYHERADDGDGRQSPQNDAPSDIERPDGWRPNPREREETIIIERRGPHPGMHAGHPMRSPPHMQMQRPRNHSIDSQNSMQRGYPSPISSVADDDFPWDSDIDAPASLASSFDSGSDSDSLDEMYAGDPWRATCVIGLRICTLDENVDVEVVQGSQRREARGEIAMGRARSPA